MIEMEFFGAMAGITIAWLSVVFGLATLLFPIFWVWMLIDGILRNDYEYPGGGGTNEKLVWVLLMALVQFVAVFYFFMVYRKVPRGSTTLPTTTTTAGYPSAPGTAA